MHGQNPEREERTAGKKDELIPLVEEHPVLTKRRVLTGKVRVRTIVENFEEIAKATLESDSIEVKRVMVGRMIDDVPQARTEGDVTIVPVVEEVLVLEKKLLLKEEVHILRRVKTEVVAAPVTLRRQKVVVENLDAAGNTLTEEEHSHDRK